MISLLLFIISVYFPQPWYTYPPAESTVKRFLCKGWVCKESEFPFHQHDEFALLMKHYINGDYEDGLAKKMEQYIERGFFPAYCAAGFFSMIGIAGYHQNLSFSYEMLREGMNHDLWSCYDIMSFHPYVKNIDEHLKVASEKGGIWSMLYRAFSNDNKTESLEMLIHVATSATSGWWKRRRSGNDFANAVSCILGFNSSIDDNKDAWKILKKLAKSGNLPAAIWTSNGYLSGEIGKKDIEKGIRIISPYIANGPWRIDLSELVESDDIEDKAILYDMAAKIGERAGISLKSYAT